MVKASWWVATGTDESRSPDRVDTSTTAYVVTSSAARRVSVRTTRATAARAAAAMPARSGRSERVLPPGAADDDDARGPRRRPPGRAPSPRAEPAMPRSDAVDQQQVEHDVEHVAADGDHQRGPGVLEPAEHPGRGEHDQQRGDAEEGDPQVRRRRSRLTSAPAPNAADQRVGERHAGDGGEHADQHGEPEPVDALGQRAAQVAGAEVAGDAAVVP